MKHVVAVVVLLALVAGCKMSTSPQASIERGGAKPNPVVIIKCDERARPIKPNNPNAQIIIEGRSGTVPLGHPAPTGGPISKNAEPVIICDR